MRNTNLDKAVIALHELSRIVEGECGKCRVSIEIERCADQLHEIVKQRNTEESILAPIIEIEQNDI